MQNGQIVTFGSNHELCVCVCVRIYIYIYIPYRCKVEQPDALQHKGMTILNRNVQVEVRSFVKSTWKLLPLKLGSAPHKE